MQQYVGVVYSTVRGSTFGACVHVCMCARVRVCVGVVVVVVGGVRGLRAGGILSGAAKSRGSWLPAAAGACCDLAPLGCAPARNARPATQTQSFAAAGAAAYRRREVCQCLLHQLLGGGAAEPFVGAVGTVGRGAVFGHARRHIWEASAREGREILCCPRVPARFANDTRVCQQRV